MKREGVEGEWVEGREGARARESKNCKGLFISSQ